MTRFLRTASPRNLLAAALGALLVAAAGGTIAVAATSGGAVPRRQSLPRALHAALAAPAIRGLSARISFTDSLIPSADFQGSDPLLSGGSGRLWVSPAAHRLRIEVQGESGDAQLVVNGRSFWVYDPSTKTVFRGTLPARAGAAPAKPHEQMPTVAAISQRLSDLGSYLNISGARPTDVAGQPAYAVSVSPKRHGGLVGSLGLAWDALRGVPLHFAVYAKGVSAPVLALTVSRISFGAVPASDFSAAPPRGAKVVPVDTSSGQPGGAQSRPGSTPSVTGVGPVASKLPFTLSAPDALAGYPRSDVKLLGAGSAHPGALLRYGQGLDGVLVFEQAASGQTQSLSSGGGDHQGLSIPTVTIGGSSAQELQTPLGTALRFTRGGVAFTVLGSEPATIVEAAARGL